MFFSSCAIHSSTSAELSLHESSLPSAAKHKYFSLKVTFFFPPFSSTRFNSCNATASVVSLDQDCRTEVSVVSTLSSFLLSGLQKLILQAGEPSSGHCSHYTVRFPASLQEDPLHSASGVSTPSQGGTREPIAAACTGTVWHNECGTDWGIDLWEPNCFCLVFFPHWLKQMLIHPLQTAHDSSLNTEAVLSLSVSTRSQSEFISFLKLCS